VSPDRFRTGGCRILIARAPLRLSLAGAGTDLPAYARRFGGLAIIATIDRFAYAMVSETDPQREPMVAVDFTGLIETGQSTGADGLDRPAHSLLDEFGISRGVSVFITSELPPYTGMGAVSASVVALAWALARLKGETITPQQAARLASAVGWPDFGGNSQDADAYGQAVGGFNYIDSSGIQADATPMALSDELRLALEERLMLFSTGRVDDQNTLQHVGRAAGRERSTVIEALHEIKNAAIDLRRDLQRGKIDSVGDCFSRTWAATRRLAPSMSDPWIDQCHKIAVEAGATGGKLNGLGGAGFLLFYSEPDAQQRVADALEAAGLRRIPMHFETNGVSMLLDETTSAERSTLSYGVAG
jgi:D-glycero-alpha-D-manno-heptose-7-phosphate kinase